jgi:DnaK suppressor protein
VANIWKPEYRPYELEHDLHCVEGPDSLGQLKGASIVKADLKLVREVLKSQLKEAGPIRRLGDSIRTQQHADPVDMTQEAAEPDIAVQMLDRESTLARQLRSAIDRIENGSYGICLQCEEDIAPKNQHADSGPHQRTEFERDTVGRVVHPLPGER